MLNYSQLKIKEDIVEITFKNCINLLINDYCFIYDGTMVVAIYDNESFCLGEVDAIVDPEAYNKDPSYGEKFDISAISDIFFKKEICVTSVDFLYKIVKDLKKSEKYDSYSKYLCLDLDQNIVDSENIEDSIFQGTIERLTFFELFKVKESQLLKIFGEIND